MLIRKLLTISVLLLLIYTKAHSQTTVEYLYDEAGNRIERKVLILQTKKNQSNQDLTPLTDKVEEKQITIFPNPTQGQLLVRVEGGDYDVLHNITVYNTSGAKLMNIKHRGNGDIPVEMSSYTAGTYILVLNYGDTKKTYKIIKQ